MKNQQKGTAGSEARLHLHQTGQPAAPAPSRTRSHTAILSAALLFLLIGSILFLVPYQQFRFSPAWVFEHVQSRFQQVFLYLLGESSAFGITIYQYLAVILAGAALAACGTVFQRGFRNSLAGPSTMGIMAGGTLGTLVYLLVFTSTPAGAAARSASAGLFQQQICTWIGCAASVALVLLAATAAGRGSVSSSAMILSGTVFSSITSSASLLIQYYMLLQDPTDPRIDTVRALMMGSFNRITNPAVLAAMAAPILICLLLLLLLRGKLDLLSLDDEEAVSLGFPLHRYRLLVIAIGTVLTATVVSFCGHIGFLGFMIPLIAKKISGPGIRALLPVSMLLGAILLTAVYDIAYIVGMTDYLNLFTSSIGGVVFVVTLLAKKGDR